MFSHLKVVCVICSVILLIGFNRVIVDASPQVSEGQQIALEKAEVMLPPKKLSKTIDEQLQAIRTMFPEMAEVHHRAKWAAGELILSSTDQNAIRNLNSSRYGPIKSVEKIGSSESPDTYRVVFSKPYHPARLVERVRSELGIEEVEANLYMQDGNDVSYHASAPLYSTYTFKMGWGDCQSECTYRHYWEFSVAPTQETLTVKLEKEYGSDLALRNL